MQDQELYLIYRLADKHPKLLYTTSDKNECLYFIDKLKSTHHFNKKHPDQKGYTFYYLPVKIDRFKKPDVVSIWHFRVTQEKNKTYSYKYYPVFDTTVIVDTSLPEVQVVSGADTLSYAVRASNVSEAEEKLIDYFLKTFNFTLIRKC